MVKAFVFSGRNIFVNNENESAKQKIMIMKIKEVKLLEKCP